MRDLRPVVVKGFGKPVTRMAWLLEILEDLEREVSGPLSILETGCMRGSDRVHVVEFGASTLYIAQWIAYGAKYEHQFTSIDLDPSVAHEILENNKVGWTARFIKADSRVGIRQLKTMLDFVLLDTANGPHVVWSEFKLVRRIAMPHCRFVVDDAPQGKGTSIMRYLEAHDIPYVLRGRLMSFRLDGGAPPELW